ncbi:MAG: hypothetical protein ACHQ1H_10670, partial [Nitrososphaerales archaeon]
PDLDRKQVANSLARISKTVNELGENFVSNYRKTKNIDEAKIYDDSKKYLENRMGAAVTIHSTEDSMLFDPKKKAQFALPFKPALYFE